MEFKRVDNLYVIRLIKGEEIITTIREFCKRENIRLGQVTGIGATDRLTIGLFDAENKKYKKKEFTGLMEITSLVGNITTKDGETYLHFHINVCDSNMNIIGGHLDEAYISPTGEIIITKIDGEVEREFDPSLGINLLKF